ncbi:nitrate reductase molybdenum cofactor assembly chaperone [Indiicoccus explosivorum]|uniref:nitrate reductase molybdenum cofactor assembly chaperone n=1 Tax=Indiicoccus explosivorum TaxID=1917864 RepID=UPI001F4DB524|nr:molecular chaperone TorD family protein [Indiicoccus explosivorum]
MTGYQDHLLIAASRLLSYPAGDDERDVLDCLTEMEAPAEIRQQALAAADAIYSIPLKERMELYVATFDLKTECGLYLSAHEFGDSPKRGAALIRLQKIIGESGYERTDGELSDFIPLLFEFTAVAGAHMEKGRLMKRLGAVTQRIADHLSEEHPYRRILMVLMDAVFEAPTEEELKKMEMDREEADLEDLPYPIMYN